MKNACVHAIESLVPLEANYDAANETSVRKETSFLYSVYQTLIEARHRDPLERSQSRSD
jgi:hypothetical protein